MNESESSFETNEPEIRTRSFFFCPYYDLHSDSFVYEVNYEEFVGQNDNFMYNRKFTTKILWKQEGF
jgi:hypothetical protein